MFYSALMLTGVNLLLRLAGTSFQVYISARIGAAGVGLLQLTMSVGSLATIAGIGGIRTASMYLTAEELGRRRPGSVPWVLSKCFVYSILCSGAVALLLFSLAPTIALVWIGDRRTEGALRVLAAFLPVTGLCAVMTGYFTAANRIGTLAAVEVAEQLFTMAVTLLALALLAGQDAGKACQCILLGSGLGGCLTLGCLTALRLREHQPIGPSVSLRSRLLQAAVPLALADILKAGISAAENLMVPRRLALHPGTADPLASFGTVSGMVFPVLMFPACILFALAELLIPELARCAAAESRGRIRYLVRRSLKVAALYALTFGGMLYLAAEPLCRRLYGSAEAGRYLRLYAMLSPMLYCDAIVDAMTKGLGQQKICVRYNILTSAMDVAFLYLLLPRWGMEGYFVSFLITHLVNFILSLRRLLRISGVRLPFHAPALALACTLGALWCAGHLKAPVSRCASFAVLLGSLLTLSRVIGREDLTWFLGILRARKPKKPPI